MRKTMYRGNNAGRGISGNIWYDCNFLEMLWDNNMGTILDDDFTQALEATHGWAVGGTNNTATFLATEINGVMQIGATGADNDEGWLTSGNNEAGMVKFADAAPRRVWFEARIRLPSIADQGVFVGLAEEGLAAAATLIDDTGALASKDMVGFHIDTDAPSTIDAVYRTAAAAATVHSAGVQTAVAATWYKLGMRYGLDDKLQYYVDGVKKGDPLDVSANTTLFPDDEELAVLIGVKTGEAVVKYIDVDWVRCVGEI